MSVESKAGLLGAKSAAYSDERKGGQRAAPKAAKWAVSTVGK